MAKKAKHTDADKALGPMPTEQTEIGRVVAKNAKDAWPAMMEMIAAQSQALLVKHTAKIKKAHKDAGEIENPKTKYRGSLTWIIDSEDPNHFGVEVDISYPSGLREAFSAKTKDTSKSLVAVGPDLADRANAAAASGQAEADWS